MKTNSIALKTVDRRGSTLIIIIALLGLLAFTGMVFFTFASQERASAEYFSEGAKTSSEEVDDPFPWALQQIIVGPTNQPEHKGSILWSPTQRHSMVRNLVGRDAAPFNGSGLHPRYLTSALLSLNDRTDNYGDPLTNRLNFVDALSAWGSSNFTFGQQVESVLTLRRDFITEDQNMNGVLDGGEDLDGDGFLDVEIAAPDVDFTAPDINSLFLAFKGSAIRDNGVEEDANLNGVLDLGEDLNGNGRLDRRFEMVQMIIPSFFRPQYLKSTEYNFPSTVGGTLNVPTDPDWFNETLDPAHSEYSVRSFRPHPLHISGFTSGVPIRRYLDRNNPAHIAAIAALPGNSGPFPLRPSEGNPDFNNSANFGRLGVWTGHGAATASTFELDSDNDGDGIREGIWLDLRYPIQETPDGKKYTVLHSFTIYDLDALINLNAHGNLSGLARNAASVPGLAGGDLATVHISQSNLGIGPHEINPLYALAPSGTALASDAAFSTWYGANPTTRLEQANMEFLWLTTGRIDTTKPSPEVLDGRWGDANALWFHRFGAGARSVRSLPRPGKSGPLSEVASSTSEPLPEFRNFALAAGFDDNEDVFEGIASQVTGRTRGFVHPLDYSGRGDRTAADPKFPLLYTPAAGRSEQWLRYTNYPVSGTALGQGDEISYVAGPDGNPATGADNLAVLTDAANDSNYNVNFEDPYETIMDQDRAVRPDDQIFTAADLISAHLTKTDQDSATGLSDRLEKLAPFTFADNSSRSQFFTTLSNSFRYFSLPQDVVTRPWEWTADTDGDSKLEFPPMFGTAIPFTSADPFRPQVRRMLFSEQGESRGFSGQLPLSLNHILDVNRTANTPVEGTPEFIAFMRRSGIRFRQITEHPLSTDQAGTGTVLDSVTDIPNVPTTRILPAFPPTTPEEKEFWARRDRQQLARDIYVLLYTTGGAEWDTVNSRVFDYTSSNVAVSPDPTLVGRTLYNEDRLRLMAQFAVNVVDAMDSDNVITKFEFDKNLGDGWGLDDDPYTFSSTSDSAVGVATVPANITRDGMYPDDVGDRGVVYGVESQVLAFSEVLGIASRNTSDTPATPFNDAHPSAPTEATYYLFAELQNMLPATVSLGSGLTSGESADTAVWRIVRQDRTTASDPSQLPTEVVSINNPTYFVAFATNVRNAIQGGGRFTIAATNADWTSGSTPSSDFFVDLGAYDTPTSTYVGNFDGQYELIAPNAAGALPTTSTPVTDPEWGPRADLDLISHAGNYFQQTTSGFLDGIGTYLGHGGLLAGASVAMPAGGRIGLEDPDAFAALSTGLNEGFDLILQRKLNPDMPSLITDPAENPWIEVDRIRVQMEDFNIDVADVAADVRSDSGSDHIKNVRSWERGEPLLDLRTQRAVVTTTTRAFRSNSIKGDLSATPDDTLGTNSTNTSGFNVLHFHPDRDFASAIELFNVPVFPPNLLTQRLNWMRKAPYQQLGGGTVNPLALAGAAALFLFPDTTPEPATPDAASANDNRWYRLLQFVEVPSRVNRQLGNYVNLTRVPGKLNLNTLRNREVFAGLLDDGQFISNDPLSDFDGDGDLDGPFMSGSAFDGIGLPHPGAVRDRWLEFLNERDGNVLAISDPTPNLHASGDETNINYWIPGTPNSRPFRSPNHRTTVVNSAAPDDNGIEDTVLRRFAFDKNADTSKSRGNLSGEGPASSYSNGAADPMTNRHWLEVGDRSYHTTQTGAETMFEHHQLLAKVLNNTTTVSNSFIVFGTAAYFEIYEDPTSGLVQVGGRMGLDLDGDSDQRNDAGWERRAVFIVDRTEFYNAYDPGSGTVDWKRLVKYRQDLSSDGK